ncbi:MAG TPA: type I-B CRISPR-associated endonuclease Cas1 [Clostridia bacterium]|nr:type I-B CRISPR-associated endonuclease Cas1 [Clostridia bacterium]
MQKTLYIFQSGRIKRKDNTVAVENEECTKYFPIANLRDIVVLGEVDMNKKFLEFAEENEIVVHFFGYYGEYVGSFYPREHYNSGYIILRQAEHYLDARRRLTLARKFVEGALANILQVMRYYQNRGKEIGSYIDVIARLAENNVPQCSNVEELMAIEGNARACYYESFNAILQGAPFSLSGRTKRPPGDPLNALISFGNSLVYIKVLTEIYKTHLDPRIGYLHATNFRRFTLNLDVAEVFKPILADRTLFTLVGRRVLDKNDFEHHGDAVFLKESGRKAYIREFEEKLQTTFYHRRLKRNVSYQTLMRLELYKLEKHLIGEEEYQPFVSRW